MALRFVEMVKLIDAQLGPRIARIFPADLDGLRIVPNPVKGVEDSVTLAELDQALAEILVVNGWIRTSLKDNRVLVERTPPVRPNGLSEWIVFIWHRWWNGSRFCTKG